MKSRIALKSIDLTGRDATKRMPSDGKQTQTHEPKYVTAWDEALSRTAIKLLVDKPNHPITSHTLEMVEGISKVTKPKNLIMPING